jgi:hypothetical protein
MWSREVGGVVACTSHCVVWSHWTDRKRQPCTLELGACILCDTSKQRRWEAWLAVRPFDAPGLRLVPITAAAARSSKLPHFHDGGPSWLGWRVKLIRLGPGKTAPVRLLANPPRAGEPLPSPLPDLPGWIRRLYGVESPEHRTRKEA